jgi:hypothetical protein
MEKFKKSREEFSLILVTNEGKVELIKGVAKALGNLKVEGNNLLNGLWAIKLIKLLPLQALTSVKPYAFPFIFTFY